MGADGSEFNTRAHGAEFPGGRDMGRLLHVGYDHTIVIETPHDSK